MSFDNLTKLALIDLAKQHNIGLGDYARTSKAEIIALLADAGVPVPESVPEPVTVGDEPEQAATRFPKKADALRDALLDVIGKPPLDADEVRKIAEEAIAKAMANVPVRTETIIVTEGKADIKVNGEVSATVKKILQKVRAGVNIMLCGPAGCGKSTIAAETAKLLGKRFVSLSCQAGMSVSNFNGWLLPVGDGGKFVYVSSEFIDAYEKGNAVILIDELDGADANLLLSINSALANGHISIPQRFEGPTVKRGEGVIIIATANTLGRGGDLLYIAREQLDESTVDRFRAGRIIVGYDAKFEEANVHTALLAFARKVRERIEALKLRRVLSTRWLLDATRCITLGGETLAEVIDTFFVDWSADDRSKVWQ